MIFSVHQKGNHCSALDTKVSIILFWNSLGAEEMSKGMATSGTSQRGVIKVVSLLKAG